MVASAQFATAAQSPSPTSSSSAATRPTKNQHQHQKQLTQQHPPHLHSSSYLSKASKSVSVGIHQNGHHHSHRNNGGRNNHQQQTPQTTNKLTPHEERIKKLMTPPPTSMTLTAALQLLQPKTPHQSVYLVDKGYLQNWLYWAYHQPLASSSSSGGGTGGVNGGQQHNNNRSSSMSETSRVHEALRLAAVQEGLTPPNDNVDIDDTTTIICDPGPIDSSALSVEGHPRLLSPLVQVSHRPSSSSSNTGTGSAVLLNQPISLTRTQSARTCVSSTTASDNDNDGGTIECLAVPEAFYDTLRSVHGVLCDDGFSVSFQAEDTERLLLHHQPYHHSHHQNNNNGGTGSRITSHQARDPPPRPIEFRRKLVPLVDDDSATSNNHSMKNNYSSNNKNNKEPSLMDKLLAEEEQRRQPRCIVEVHPLKLIYAQWNSDLSRTELAGFGLVSRQALAVDALDSMLRAAFPHKATQALRLWCKFFYNQQSSVAGAAVQKCGRVNSQCPTPGTGDGYEIINLQALESKRLSLQEWIQHLIPPPPPPNSNYNDTTANNSRPSSSSNMNEIQLLIETRQTVNAEWPRLDMQLSERLRVGDFVDAQDVAGKWYEGQVRQIDDTHVTVHYLGWASRWDAKLRRRVDDDNENGGGGGGPTTAAAATRVLPPAPLWTRTQRWRERVEVGQTVEVRDSSSRAERPKWYKGIVRKVGLPSDPARDLKGGAELETYPVLVADDNDKDDPETKERLRLLHRTQQVLVEVEQEKTQTNTKRASNAGSATSAVGGDLAATGGDRITPEPPYLRWVDLYGEEICMLGTHLKDTDGSQHGRPVTLQYEYDVNRKPVEVLKSHPTLGSGFMRESLRGTPPAPGSVGLHNLGNSCFLNSTVQCLNHMELLTQYFIQDKHMKELNRKNPLGSGGNVALAYASILKKMWGGEYSILVPRMLKQTVANFAPQFDNSYQHDSQEFCQFLMDGLHEDLNRVKTKPYVEELEGFGMDDQKAAIESWRKHLLRHDSVIVDHCQGMHRSHLTCPRCGRESIKFDVFSSISLPLATFKKRTNIKLEDCLEKFMEGEQLDERNAWYCPSCRQHVCALKMIALWSVPDILILHLKRFTFDTCMTSGGMLRSKMDDTVIFPIEGLDLTKQILGPIDPQAPPIFRLFGVSEHVGPTANSGHYTATVRNSIDQQWYKYNDSHVGLTSGEASITGGAYLLFYQRSKGISKWAGMGKVMKERGIDPYGGLDADQDGFTQVNSKKSKKRSKKTGQ